MSPWWGKSSKEVKKSNRESIIGALHRKCIRPGAPRRQRSDTSSEKVSQSRPDSQSPSPSKSVSRCQSFGERPQAQPLPLPHNHFSNICHADSGKNASIDPSLNRGSKTSVLPLPKPGHVKIGQRAVGGERDLAIASSSSDSSSDTDDPSDSRLLSPQASDYENGVKSDTTSPSGLKQTDQTPFASKRNSKEMLKPANILLNHQTSPLSPPQRPVKSNAAHLQVPNQYTFLSAPDSSMSSPSRSPMTVFGHEPVTNSGFWLGKPHTDVSVLGSGNCSSPGSVQNSGHNSVAGDVSCQLFWPQSRCSPECSPLPSPRMTSPGPGSRIHSGTVTPTHPRAGGPSAESSTSWPDDGKQQSHRLPLPPVAICNPSPFTHSAGTSPRIPWSPGRTDNPPSPGSRWKKGRLLGRGTFGHVYLGFNSESGEMCAMKEVTLFSDDAKSRECAQQLGQEVALLSRLRHPNIVQYYGSETVDDRLYIYLEYVSGGSIYKILQEYGQLGEAAIRSYTQQILSGLAYLHATNTVHRDIKGANILVDPNGRVKLADFGMAKHITGQACPLSFKGSPYWMAPEVIKNSSGCNLAVVDIWSLGCTVLEMATTKPPWSQYEGVAALFKIGNSRELPEIPDYLSDDGKDFVRLCLQRNPSLRPTAARLLEHRFVKNSVCLERPIVGAEPKESVPALVNAVRALGIGHSRTSPCLDSSGANHSRAPNTVLSLSDGYSARNMSCPVSALGSPLSRPRSPQTINERMLPSPITSPRATSGASTPPQYHSKTANHLHEGMVMASMPQNTFHAIANGYQEHKLDVFRGIVQAHLSLEAVSRENNFPGNKVERPNLLGRREQLYDAHLVLADRVSQQLLRNPVRLNQGLDPKQSSSVPRRNNGS